MLYFSFWGGGGGGGGGEWEDFFNLWPVLMIGLHISRHYFCEATDQKVVSILTVQSLAMCNMYMSSTCIQSPKFKVIRGHSYIVHMCMPSLSLLLEL